MRGCHSDAPPTTGTTDDQFADEELVASAANVQPIVFPVTHVDPTCRVRPDISRSLKKGLLGNHMLSEGGFEVNWGAAGSGRWL